MPYPDLQVVLNWSIAGAWLSDKFNSNTSQLFAFGAITGVVSNYKGYMSEDYPIPEYGLLIAGILAGYLGTHPILGYTKTSIVLGCLAYPTYLVYKELKSMDVSVNVQMIEELVEDILF